MRDTSNRDIISFTQFLLESSSKTIQNLSKEFGSQNVFSRMLDFTFDDKSLKKMFEVLNESLFDSKLSLVPLDISHEGDISNFVRKTSKDTLKTCDFYAMYYTAFDFIYNESIQTDDLKTIEDQNFSFDKVRIRYKHRRLFVNVDELHDSNVIFAANCICHEMIHQFDQKYGEGEDVMMRSSRLDINVNTHTTPTFMKMRERAMRDKMKIIDDGNGISYEQLNKEAYDFMVSEAETVPLRLEKCDGDDTVYVDVSGVMHNVGGFALTGNHSGVMIYCD